MSTLLQAEGDTIWQLECFHVMSLPSWLQRKTENSRHVGVQDRSFYGDLHEMSDIIIMLLICVESDKIPLLNKLKQLYKRLPVGFYTVHVVHQDSGLFLVYGILITWSQRSIQVAQNHVYAL